MIFEFAKYTDVTSLAKKCNKEYETSNYVKVYLCCDTNSFWLARILEGYDSDYNECEGTYVLERDMIDKVNKNGFIDKTIKLSVSKARELLSNDDFSSWDIMEFDSLEEAVDAIDGGFGIN